MSLSGLYYYFTTKEELLYLIQERCFLTLLQRWEQAGSADVDVRARIRVFAENHLSFFLHNMHEMKVMAHEDESLTREFDDKIRAQAPLRQSDHGPDWRDAGTGWRPGNDLGWRFRCSA
jgi:AcrR family transcriptional regulator